MKREVSNLYWFRPGLFRFHQQCCRRLLLVVTAKHLFPELITIHLKGGNWSYVEKIHNEKL